MVRGDEILTEAVEQIPDPLDRVVDLAAAATPPETDGTELAVCVCVCPCVCVYVCVRMYVHAHLPVCIRVG